MLVVHSTGNLGKVDTYRGIRTRRLEKNDGVGGRQEQNTTACCKYLEQGRCVIHSCYTKAYPYTYILQ